MKALRDIKKEEELFRIPLSLLLSVENIKSPIQKPFEECGIKGDTALALMLLWERSLGSESRWAPWIKVLPREYSQPLFWSPSERAELKGSNLAVLTDTLDEQVRQDYLTMVTPLVEKFPQQFHSENFSEQLFRWALATIWSRAFDTQVNGRPLRVLVPFADLFNHQVFTLNFSPQPAVVEQHKFEQQSKSLVCVTSSPYKQGDQVFINYGPFPNHKLLRLYGFTLENNPHDCVELWAPMSPEAPLFQLKMEVLRKHNIQNEQSFELRNGKVPNELLATLRVQRIQPQEFSRIDRAFSNQIISEENELEVLEALIGALKGMLGAYPTTFEEDRQLLAKSKGGNSNKYYALVLRFSEKEILKKDIHLLEQIKQRLK